MDVQWETVSSYGRKGISLNVYRSNEDHLHCDWIEDVKEIVTATNYKHFQHRAEKLITELIASVEKEPTVNTETYTAPAAGSIGTAKVGEKVICYDEYLHDYVEHTMLVRTIEKDPEMKTETNPEGVVLYGIDLSDADEESMICTVSEGNYVRSAGMATVSFLHMVFMISLERQAMAPQCMTLQTKYMNISFVPFVLWISQNQDSATRLKILVLRKEQGIG